MSKFSYKEKIVAEFQTALETAGMQPSAGLDDFKPRYFRGNVTESSDSIYLSFTVTDDLEDTSADNDDWLRTIYIDGELYCRKGSGDAEYQTLANNIEFECKKVGITVTFGGDGTIAPVDTEQQIYFCRFEAYKTYLKGAEQ